MLLGTGDQTASFSLSTWAILELGGMGHRSETNDDHPLMTVWITA